MTLLVRSMKEMRLFIYNMQLRLDLFRGLCTYSEGMQFPAGDLFLEQGQDGALSLQALHVVKCRGGDIYLEAAAFTGNADLCIRVESLYSIDQVLFVHSLVAP